MCIPISKRSVQAAPDKEMLANFESIRQTLKSFRNNDTTPESKPEQTHEHQLRAYYKSGMSSFFFQV